MNPECIRGSAGAVSSDSGRRARQAGTSIDNRCELLGGIVFDGPVELRESLVRERGPKFTTNITRRLLVFALGRRLQEFDEPTLDRITRGVEVEGYSSRTLVEPIVTSHPFRTQMGRLPEADRDQ